jgi:hypothetical protein
MASTVNDLLVWPNTVPFNAMLLTGLLKCKTRPNPPLHNYSGRFLFYNSSRGDNALLRLLPEMGQKLFTKKAIIGEGTLKLIRPLTEDERDNFARSCFMLYGAFPLGYFFDDLIIYDRPIPTAWPTGPVKGCWVPESEFQPYRDAAISSHPVEGRMPVYAKRSQDRT